MIVAEEGFEPSDAPVYEIERSAHGCTTKPVQI